MKRNAIARIIIYSVLALVLSGILFTALAVDGYMYLFDNEDEGTVVTGEEASIEAAQVRSLAIDWAAGTVEIRTADTDYITFSEQASENCKYKMAFELDDGTLSIRYRKGNIAIGFNHSIDKKDLIITVPEDWVCKELDFGGAGLQVSIQGLQVETIDLDGAGLEFSMDGGFQYFSCDGAGCELELTSTYCPTEINIDGAGCALELNLPTDAGFAVETDGLGCSFSSHLPYSGAVGNYYFGDRKCKVDVDGLGCEITIEAIAN